MAIQGSGSINMTDIAAEFGGSVPHSLSEYYRNGGAVPGNNTNVPTSGTISLSNFYNAVNEIQYVVSSSTTNFQTSSAFGSNWSTAVPKRLTINSGVTVGSSNGNPAMVIESSMGGTLIVHNSGSIQGTGGSGSSSGSGGGAGPAVRSDQNGSITFYNNSGASIYAGGGGGGRGGNGGTGGSGGTGGTGGNGSYNNHYFFPNGQSSGQRCSPGGHSYFQGPITTTGWCQRCYGGHAYANGGTTQFYYKKQHFRQGTFRNIHCLVPATQSGAGGGSGGSGGSGGAGGAGGNGQGYGQSRQNGSGGSSGAGGNGGAGGGNNGNNSGVGGTGGTGGQGGTGGTGGNGGDWGQSGGSGNGGATGNTGATGSTGASGTAGGGSGGASGSGGSGGSGGSSGGATSYYIQNRNYMTFHNSGSVAGS